MEAVTNEAQIVGELPLQTVRRLPERMSQTSAAPVFTHN